jgi:crotonobetainyl-CoA:carnitine CoA-transferase CaiB-like acyl-CoA transferase
VPSDVAWRALAAAMGEPALAGDPRFSVLAARKGNESALDSLVAGWTRNHDARTLAVELQKHGIAAAKSANSVDLISDEQLWARGFYPTVGDGGGNMKPIVGPGWRMTEQAAITAGAPRLGEHNAYVFGEILGLTDEEQRWLTKDGVIR